MADVWLEVADIAQAMGITRRAIQKRLHSFVTREVKSVGGKSGTRYLILLSSLPAAWQAAYEQRHPHGDALLAQRAPLLPLPRPASPAPTLPAVVFDTDATPNSAVRRPRRTLTPLLDPTSALLSDVVSAPTALVVADSDATVSTSAVASALSSRPEPTDSLPVPASPAGRALVHRPVGNDTSHLKGWQRRCLEARLALLAELDRRCVGTKTGVALRQLIDDVRSGQLSPELQALVPIATSEGGTLSLRTLYRWKAEREQGLNALAPRAKENLQRVPPWAPHFLKLWQRPQQPSINWVVRELAKPGNLPPGIDPPSPSTVQRFLGKMHAVDRERGRMGPRALKSLRAHQIRDISTLWPADIYSMDGHTFDAEVAHPFHGQPFRPEITTAIDIATRKIVGWSVALAESSLAVLDALRHACESHGIPAILYVDNGKGYRNALMEHQAIGFMARLGTTMTHSLPHVSQSRGVIERVHRTVWVALAKQLPTYMGKDMDDEARNRVYKITRKEIKDTGQSRLLPPWPDFLQAVAHAVADYNRDHHHSALPKITDPVTGKKRHCSPGEYWDALVAQNPDCILSVHPDESADLFRPYKVGKIQRSQVRLFGNVYFHLALEGHHGESAFIGYDIHDGQRVWVRDRNQRLIAVAEVDANRSDYKPMSAVDIAFAQRANTRKGRLERHLDEIEQEHQGSRVIEGRRATPEEEAAAAHALAELAALTAPTADAPPADERPRLFDTDLALWNWVQDHPDQATAHDQAYLAECLEDDSFRLLTEIEAQKKSRVKAA